MVAIFKMHGYKVFLSIALLAACGGGSSMTETTPPTADTTPPAVNAFTVNDGAAISANSDGSYAVSGNLGTAQKYTVTFSEKLDASSYTVKMLDTNNSPVALPAGITATLAANDASNLAYTLSLTTSGSFPFDPGQTSKAVKLQTSVADASHNATTVNVTQTVNNVPPHTLAGEMSTTSTIFSVLTTGRGVLGDSRPKVYNGFVYGYYYRPTDNRTMIYKAALDGSSSASGPLVSDATLATNPTAYGAFAADDNHRDFVIEVDRQGYIHVSGGMHSTPGVTHWYSTNSEDVSAFEASGTTGKEVIPQYTWTTFPHFWTDWSGQLFWTSLQSDADVPLASYDEATRQWTALGAPNPKNKQISFAWTVRSVSYDPANTAKVKFGVVADNLAMVPDKRGRLHFAIAMQNKVIYYTNTYYWTSTHLIYAYSDDGGKTVFKSDGTPIQFPISTDAGPKQGEVVLTESDDPQSQWILDWISIAVDKEDRPMIKATSLTTGNHLFRLESGKWVDYPNFDIATDPSTGPDGVVVGYAGKSFKRSWGPTYPDDTNTLTLSANVSAYDKAHYSHTGELVWSSLSPDTSSLTDTLTIHRTVFQH